MATESIFDTGAASPATPSASPESVRTRAQPSPTVERMFDGDHDGPRRRAAREEPATDDRIPATDSDLDLHDERHDVHDEPAPKPKKGKEGDAGEEGDEEPGDDEEAPTGDEPGEEGDETEEDDDPETEIEVEGKAQKVKLSELRDAYVKNASFEKEHAQRTEAITADHDLLVEYANESVAARKTFMEQAEAANALIQALQPSDEEWNRLKAADPARYVQEQDAWNTILGKHKGLMDQVRKVVADQNAEAARQRDLFIRGENRKLQASFPAIFHPTKGAQIKERMFKYAEKYGVSRKEVEANAASQFEIETLYKAMRYDEIQETKKAKAAPKPKSSPKPQIGQAPAAQVRRGPPPPSGGKQPGRPSDFRVAASAVQKTGRVEDAAKGFAAMFEAEARQNRRGK